MAATGSHGTLVAATVASVTLTRMDRGFRVQNRGTTDPIYYRFGKTDLTNPTVAGDDTYCLPPGTVDEWPISEVGTVRPVVVEMISAGTPAYSVESW